MYILGLDLAQKNDYSALCAIQQEGGHEGNHYLTGNRLNKTQLTKRLLRQGEWRGCGSQGQSSPIAGVPETPREFH